MQPVIQLFCALAAVSLGALAPTTNISGTASAQEYPQRPVTLIIPVAADTGADVIARVLAERLSERWGQQVVIINRPGAAGAIAAQAAASAAPDGYTLYMAVSSAFIVIPETKVKWPVDLATDFVPIGWISDQPMIIAVAPSLGVTTLSEFIDLAKRKPDDILYGAARLSVPHLTGALLNDRAGIKMRVQSDSGRRQGHAGHHEWKLERGDRQHSGHPRVPFRTARSKPWRSLEKAGSPTTQICRLLRRRCPIFKSKAGSC